MHRKAMAQTCARVVLGTAVTCGTGAIVVAVPARAATFAGAAGSIAYVRFESQGTQILTVSPTTKATRDLSKTNFGDDEPEYSPSGSSLVFRNNGSIFTMTASGGTRRDLTPDPQGSYDGPRWSSDGSRIVYDLNGDIGVMNSDGSGQHLLTNTGDDTQADWSPDGTLIAFTRDDGGGTQVYTISPTGTGLTNLSGVTDPQHLYYDNEPSWAPDSQHLLVTSSRAASGNQIFEMSRDGASVEAVTDSMAPDSPAYSPDGASITYTANNGDGETEVFDQPLGGTGFPITSTPDNSIVGDLSWQAKVATKLGTSPKQGVPGSKLELTLSGFGAGEPVALTFAEGSVEASLGTVTTANTGKVKTTVTVPAAATTGTATVRGVGGQTGRSASHGFTVSSG